MLAAYMKSGEITIAEMLFKEMRTKKNAVSWTTMIRGFARAGHIDAAMKTFQEMMVAGVQPDEVAMTNLLTACAGVGALDQGRWVHLYITKNGMEIDSVMGCVLIDMYAKCGSMEEAVATFRSLKTTGIASWTAVISGFAINGQEREAIKWFLRMQEAGISPNEVTFTALLTACSYAGFIEEGKMFFNSMIKDHSLIPTIEHYGCMVDLLGSAGLLEEARNLIAEMPMQPNAVIWGSLLNACKKNGDLQLGEQVGKMLVEANPNHADRYVQLAGVYAAGGEPRLAAAVRNEMKRRRVCKDPGCSVVFVDGVMHEFTAGERYDGEVGEIARAWEEMAARLREEGHETDEARKWHSEKLAVTYGMMRSAAGTTIRVYKNLKVCEDCHFTMKVISKIYGRKIAMRDRVRFHHFADGKCSCGDHW